MRVSGGMEHGAGADACPLFPGYDPHTVTGDREQGAAQATDTAGASAPTQAKKPGRPKAALTPESRATIPTQVVINGRAFAWTETDGLDPEAVLEIDAWLNVLAVRHRDIMERLNLGDHMDALQTARLVALQVARDFRPGGKGSFVTWVTNNVKWAFAKISSAPYAMSLDNLNEDGKPFEKGDDGAAAEEMWGVAAGDAPQTHEAAKAEVLKTVQALFRQISEKERDIFCAYHGIGVPRESGMALAQRYGCSNQVIYKRLKVIRKRLTPRDTVKTLSAKEVDMLFSYYGIGKPKESANAIGRRLACHHSQILRLVKKLRRHVTDAKGREKVVLAGAI